MRTSLGQRADMRLTSMRLRDKQGMTTKARTTGCSGTGAVSGNHTRSQGCELKSTPPLDRECLQEHNTRGYGVWLGEQTSLERACVRENSRGRHKGERSGEQLPWIGSMFG